MPLRVLLHATFVFLLALQGCDGERRVTAHVGDVPARVELALTEGERALGLMHREALAQDEGMLLVMPGPRVIRIWMLNTRIPLDVGFFDETGRLLNIASMAPDGGEKIHRSVAPALYALEMNRGWFQRHGIDPGAVLRLPYPVVAE